MGKNLKGKECGKGIYQRKDGLYSARYYSKDGKRKEKYFETLPEAKNWLADARYEERHCLIVTSPDMTVDKWFTYWIENIVCDLAPNTKRNYRERYKWNIQPVIGAMCIGDVKPMHCKAVLNRMETTYAGSTIRQTYITMGTLFKSAVMNDIIAKHPMNGVRYTKPVRAVDDIKYLTVEDQEKFLEAAKRSHNYGQYALLLETGLRTAELIGLTWDSIDWKRHTLTVSKSLEIGTVKAIGEQARQRQGKAIALSRLQIERTQFSKNVMTRGRTAKNLKRCHRFWNIPTAEREKRNTLSCVI